MSTLFQPIRINGMQLKNRLVRSATHEGMADSEGMPTEALAGLYEQLARGGVGLIVSGFAFVAPEGRSDVPGMLSAGTDDCVAAWRPLTSRVHAAGASIGLQLVHAGRQTTTSAINTRPLAPSAVRNRLTGETPRPLTEQEISRIAAAFGQAARRAREAGFDCAQIHAAHGYLLSAFLCPWTNRRRDRWGGALENRVRVISAVYDACRREAGYDFPLLIKINGRDAMRRGLRLAEAVEMAALIEAMGFDALEVSCGIADDGWSAVRGALPLDVLLEDLDIFKGSRLKGFLFRHVAKLLLRPPPFSQAYNRDCARAIRQRTGVPIVAVGGNTDPCIMEEILTAGDADMIGLCRALIFDPAWPRTLEQGSRQPSGCIHCNHCLYYSSLAPLRCYNGRRIKRT